MESHLTKEQAEQREKNRLEREIERNIQLKKSLVSITKSLIEENEVMAKPQFKAVNDAIRATEYGTKKTYLDASREDAQLVATILNNLGKVFQEDESKKFYFTPNE